MQIIKSLARRLQPQPARVAPATRPVPLTEQQLKLVAGGMPRVPVNVK